MVHYFIVLTEKGVTINIMEKVERIENLPSSFRMSVNVACKREKDYKFWRT